MAKSIRLLVIAGLAFAPGRNAVAQQAAAMSPAAARAYLQSHQIGLGPDSLTQQILDGNAAGLEAMIAAGVNVNAKAGFPQGPLELATMSCIGDRVQPAVTARIVGDLIKAGADVNAPGIQGLGPLMSAAQQCSAAVVKRLIEAGAKLDSRTPQGFTPLSMAIIVKHYGVAQVLIDAGARISAETARKFTEGSTDEQLNDIVKRATEGAS